MGQDELKKALVLETEERIRKLWAEAETEVADLRNRIDTQHEERAKQAARQRDAILAEMSASSRHQVLEEERRAILRAESRLSERLFSLAGQLLPQIVAEDRTTWLKRLAAELPDASWDEVRVNPKDTQQAAELFPDCRIVADEALSGGAVVEADDGRVRIDNSLEKRLERRWDDILPLLFVEIRERVSEDDDASAAIR